MNETIYVVQGFEAGKRGALKAMPPVTCATESQARDRAERLGVRCAGVIAFAQTADIDTGEYADPVMLVQLGQVLEQA
ncbi:hypothetical protein L2Y94_05575 [Luteibacter aegosomatis]|uniref:hypothetical protein n=1 Tax=Luteibacter aegosomatis TaxID=2911537 RepID=UPI001FF93EE4|nr:hypothetical protein [Luteibacter aegosomatis]UPG86824.1 hypothetical protein L2Y94_05575 [Luteibacter aegosomatis]